MPKIVISGINEEVVRTVTPRLIPAVAEALACRWSGFPLNMCPRYTLAQRGRTGGTVPWWKSTGSSALRN